MKNPANTSNGITMGTTNAEAASGVGVETPISAPRNKYIQAISKKTSDIILVTVPAAAETILHKIRIPTKVKYTRTSLYKFAIQYVIVTNTNTKNACIGNSKLNLDM